MIFDGQSYSHNTHQKFMMIRKKYEVNEDVDTYQSLLHKVMFMQITTKKGIQLFGEGEIADMFKEYKQLDDGTMSGKTAVAPSYHDGLTPLEIKKTLKAVNLIKEKRCVNIKGRNCTNARKKIK